ncbi:MAG: hypothetical protein OXC40_03865 [Proteobacteria bacterium]|nr:hypothetical protein [Pseudomonadota bacterium]
MFSKTDVRHEIEFGLGNADLGNEPYLVSRRIAVSEQRLRKSRNVSNSVERAQNTQRVAAKDKS